MIDATTGTRVAAIDYGPYGNRARTNGSVTPGYQFAGLFYHPRTGLMLSATRALDVGTGRWLSRDTIHQAAGPNEYMYAGANPISRIDPMGMDADVIQMPSTPGNDPIIKFANSLPETPGYITVVGHGGPKGIQAASGGSLNADQIIALIKDSDRWKNHNGADIKYIELYACETGASETEFGHIDLNVAQEIARKLGKRVRAPTTLIWWTVTCPLKVSPV